MARARAAGLLVELDLARAHTTALVADLTDDEVRWRPSEQASGIGWHLGHQSAVAHVMFRNLMAAEPSIDPELERLFDSATPEPARGALPSLDEIVAFREAVAGRTAAIAARILDGRVGAPVQLEQVLASVLTCVVNHEYQHDTWIGEVRAALDRPPGPDPASARIELVEGYWMLRTEP